MIRRLGPGDEALLRRLAEEDADFDLADRGAPLRPLAPDAARRYLADPTVLHWVAEIDGDVGGHLLCYVERRRSGEELQLLLYEIGVRDGQRRRGIGRALLAEMSAWMHEHEVTETWVLADNADAELFYAACGFVRDDEQGVMYTLHRRAPIS